MSSWIVSLIALIAGSFVGYGISKVYKWLESVKLPFVGVDLLVFLAESMYFAMILCAPISGNLIISLLILAIFVYALYGGYGSEGLKPLKEEDKVDSKWFPRYP